MGMKWVTCFNYKTRKDAIDLYKKIDILVIGAWDLGDPNPHRIPTKIINAASFGIPSVVYPLDAYKEIKGYFIGAGNMKQLISGVEALRDKKYYKRLSEKVARMAEGYHISKIAELYRKL